MKQFAFKTYEKKILADTITPVSVFLKIRDLFPNAVLLESSDYHGSQNSRSFICIEPLAGFMVNNGTISEEFPDGSLVESQARQPGEVAQKLSEFVACFAPQSGENTALNGIFGYTAYDAIPHFEDIRFEAPENPAQKIPEIRYHFYRYLIVINHFQNNLSLYEHRFFGEKSQISSVADLLHNLNFATYRFSPKGEEQTNMSDKDYKTMVTNGKKHCQRGDVFQIVLSRRFSQDFEGDEFNVYRALRSINPSPYLFFFDYGNYRLFGSSPEAQIQIKNQKAFIHPIAGTFRRTGRDEQDRKLAEKLSNDPKENAEHVMLVDLARNDLSRNATNVTVERFKEIQFYSHVLHMVSVVSGELPKNTNPVKVLGDTFPAGTLSGAPKHKAMQLIDRYEPDKRGFYGGCIGQIALNGDLNHAIMIRSFLSQGNRLFYQAGAGIVNQSDEESELQEVNNKLSALKNAIEQATKI